MPQYNNSGIYDLVKKKTGNTTEGISQKDLDKISEIKAGIGYGIGSSNPLTAAAATTNNSNKNLVEALVKQSGMTALANIKNNSTLQKSGGYFPGKIENSGTGAGTSGSGGSNNAAYKSTLDDLYNKVMGYGGYQAGSYTPGTFASSVDTTGIRGQLQGWLGEIDNYEPFKYDLNADLLYRQMADNYVQQGQLAMQDAMGAAAALTGGYGNSYAASVGNQAFQQHLTQLNNNIPALQQQALNVWQSGLDQLINQYNAGTQHLNNLLSVEAQELAAWQAQEALNFDAWNANEQNAYNEWLSGYTQAQDQWELAKDYYATLEALNKSSGGGGGSSTGKSSSTSTVSKTPTQVSGILSSLGSTTNPVVAGAQLSNPLDDYFKNLNALLKK